MGSYPIKGLYLAPKTAFLLAFLRMACNIPDAVLTRKKSGYLIRFIAVQAVLGSILEKSSRQRENISPAGVPQS